MARSGLNALILSALVGLLPGAKAALAQTLCAEVRLQIKQEATLEREAFDAALEVTNQYPSYGLTNFRVNILIKNPQGVSSDNLFFVKISSKEAINAVDGTGIVQPASTATVHWLIIPSTGAGGVNPLGLTYSIRADISYDLNGVHQTISTFEDNIVVRPQPALKLEYILPFEVFADEPLTQTIEPVEPFPLGVRITNVGYGPARNFQINSGQPEIIENKQGLAIDFKLLGTYIGAGKIPDTLLIPFGDISAGGVTQAAWIMATSLSGRFVKFDATFSHAAELGGQLTSLIQGVTTYTLVKDVLVDLPGRDGQFDFLVNTTIPRGAMETMLAAGQEIVPDAILESDQAEPIRVTRLTSELAGDLNGANTSATLRLTQNIGSNLWVFTSMPAPQDGRAKLVSAVRQDGKNISSKNIWISRHFSKGSGTYSYRLNLLDYDPPAMAAYTLNFSRESLDAAPAPIIDLNAFAASVGGQAGLSWSATGEDANSGTILGGRYLIQAASSSESEFNPSFAQVNITTNTSPGVMQRYQMNGLAGNASYYVKLWVQDTGGNISVDSNLADAFVLPNPPAHFVVGAISSNSVAVAWDGGNNNLPIEYGVWADTDAVPPAAVAAPFKDPFDRAFVFAGLTPNTTYLFYGVAKNPLSGISSEQVYMGQALTLPAALGQILSSQLFPSSFTMTWDSGANSGLTEYLVQLSTTVDWSLIAWESGWVAQSSYTFSGLMPDTTYYARAKARNSAGVETAFAALGVLRTKAVDSLPPATIIAFSAPNFGAGPVYISSRTAISLSASDDAAVAGDQQGEVVAIYYSVNADTFSVYSGSFSIVGSGRYSIAYYSVDRFGNIEAPRFSSAAVDNIPPVTEIRVYGSSTTDAQGNLMVSSDTWIGFTAADPDMDGILSGLKSVMVSEDGGPYSVYQSTFAMGEGFHRLKYYAVDNVDNAEVPHTFEFFVGASPKTATWTGLAGDGNWLNPDNWLGREAPGVNDSIVLSGMDTVSISSQTVFHSLVLGDSEGLSAPILIVSSGVVVSNTVVIHKNSILTQNTLEPLRFNSLIIKSGGQLDHTINGSSKQHLVNLDIADNFIMEAGSGINATGMGYAKGMGPGAVGDTYWGYGGAYGGEAIGQSIMPAYGSVVSPDELGSGGSGASGFDRACSGGGAVIIKVGGVFQIGGKIQADGLNGRDMCGGGSGGTINIGAGVITGSGTVTANGGTGAYGYAGAGGRIRISGQGISDLNMEANSRGGSGSGTIYIERQGVAPSLIIRGPGAGVFTPITYANMGSTGSVTLGEFIMGNARVRFEGIERVNILNLAEFAGANSIENLSGETGFPGGGTGISAGSDITIATVTFPVVSTLTLTGGALHVSSLTALGSIILEGNSVLGQTSVVPWTIGELTIRTGSKLTHRANSAKKLYAVNVKVLRNMVVEAGGSVNVAGLGYAGGASGGNGYGPGYGVGSMENGGGGAGHGGNGGKGHGGTAGGVSYGSIVAPDELGSGGGGSNGVIGGMGAGQINLVVGGTLTINGSLIATGSAGMTNGSYGSGGGAGGSINIVAGSLMGLGTLDASGGAGGAGSVRGGGGGAGGRIIGAYNFPGLVYAYGAKGASMGEAGYTGSSYNPRLNPPMEISFATVSVSSVVVQWSAVNPEGTRYIVELGRNPEFSGNVLSSVTNNTSVLFEGLNPNTLYYSRAAASDRELIATNFGSTVFTRTDRKTGETWVGFSGGDWNDPYNWDNEAVPTSTDSVVIDANVRVVTYSTNPPIAFATLTLGNMGGSTTPSLKLSRGLDLIGSTITIHKNSILTQNTLEPLRFNSLIIKSGGQLDHTINGSSKQHLVNLDIADNFIMEAGSGINATGMGYAKGMGPGAVGDTYWGYGGAYGGEAIGQSIMPAYGSVVSPDELGSGGSGASGFDRACSGGGAVIIKVGGVFQIGGKIQADGLNGRDMCGGGSGGTINIGAGVITGSGTVTANGGTGAYGYAGAGGRIRISGQGISDLNMEANSRGGSGSGTIYIERQGVAPSLIIRGPGAGVFTPITYANMGSTGSVTLGEFIMGNARVRFEGIERVNILNLAEFAGANSIENLSGETGFPGGGTGISAGSDITIATVTFPVVSTLTLTGGALHVSSLTALGSIILEGNSVLGQTSVVPWTIGELTIRTGSKLTHRANSAKKLYAVNVKVLRNMVVEAGGSVNVAGLGYAGGASGGNGYGPGYGVGSMENGGGGAGHGGNGGKGHGGTAGGVSYGSIVAPDELGSGGGGSNGVIGGMGAGQINLVVGGTLTINGSLIATGSAGMTNGSYGSGGGAGGSINIVAGSLMGLGTLDASGGAGGAGSVRGGGGGAGGRIGLYGSFNGTVSVPGGSGGGLAQPGAYGTIGSYYAASAHTVGIMPEVFANASLPVSLAAVETSTGAGSAVLGAANAQGIYPVSRIYDVGPENIIFSPPLILTFRYSTSTLAEFNISESDIYLYHYDPDGSLVKVPGQVRDADRKEIIVQISQLASIFAIFGESRDNTPPVTEISFTGGQIQNNGELYVGTGTLAILTPRDPLVYSTASGIAFTEYRINADTGTVPFTAYTSPFSLPAGRNVIEFRSQDKAGNLEGIRSYVVHADMEPPAVIAVATPAANGYGWNNSPVQVVFSGTDTLSGLAYCSPEIIVSVEGASQTVSGYCTDFAGNSSAATLTLNIDRTAPRVVISSPLAGALFAAGRDMLEIRLAVADNLDPSPAVTAVLVQTEDIGAPRGQGPGSIAVVNGQTADPLALDDGIWRLEVAAQDAAGNSTQAVSGLFEVVHDTIPPQTSLSVGVPQYLAGGNTFITSRTPLLFNATDDMLIVGDLGGIGVAATHIFIDSLSVSTETVGLFITGESTHTVTYFSIDRAGNSEAARSRIFTVDDSSPVTTIAFSSAVVSFIATDLPAGAASGVSAVRYLIDSSTETVFLSTFTLAAGSHTITYWSVDNLGNTEARKTVFAPADEPGWVVKLALEPSTLNLAGKGEYVTAKLWFEGPGEGCFRPETINISSINAYALARPIYAESIGRGHGDSYKVECGTITVKFGREALIAELPVNAVVNITVSGGLNDGRNFNADDTIRTIKPRRMPRRDGGRFEHPKRACFDAPAGAFKEDNDFYVLSVEGDLPEREARKADSARAGKFERRGYAYEFGPEGTAFDKPVTISLPYDAEEKSPENLAVAYWNETAGSWEILPSRRDAAGRLVKADVPHFSQYQVVFASYAVSSVEVVKKIRVSEDGDTSILTSSLEFKLGEVYVYPNPAKGGKVPVFHIEVGKADTVKIRVFTVAGQLAHEATLSGAPQAIGSAYAYEYTWAGRIASGVYYYTIEAGNGGRKIRTKGKFAVIR